MLTRVRSPRPGKPSEATSVAEKAKEVPVDASSVRSSTSARSRHAGSSTKRAGADGLSAPFPRGAATPARGSASPEQSERGGNALVFVLSKTKQPLMPCSPARARELLQKGRAVVARLFPFVIRLKDRSEGVVQPVSLKTDPGSRVTGIALVREAEGVSHPVFFAQLHHRGGTIRDALLQRSNYRKRRRGTLRHRAPRFDNRTKPEGWLAPSQQHRVDTSMAWVGHFQRYAPVTQLACELVRFDLQQMENPEISGVEYQQGTLAGYEVREYLLEKWGRKCAYCGKKGVSLQIDHLDCRARGGSNRIANLFPAGLPDAPEEGAGLSDGRQGAGGGHQREEAGALHGTSRGAGERLL
jgi:5-methylcytosine-specific restriction endonuclease McrA